MDDEGQVNGTIQGKDALFRAWDMQGDYFKAKGEIAQEMNAKVNRVPMVAPDGRVRLVREDLEDRKGRRGFRPLISGRRRRLEDGYRTHGRIPFDFEDEE